MYDAVLIPTDGSPAMARAIESAIYHAEQAGATLHVLYVVDLRAYVMLPEGPQAQVIDLLEEDGQTAVEVVRRVADERGIEAVTAVERGVPQERILWYADEHEIDLIVMGTHGRTGEEKQMLGSVAEEVIRHAAVPVLTVRMSSAELEALPDDGTPEAQLRYIR